LGELIYPKVDANAKRKERIVTDVNTSRTAEQTL
jgi:hypothetical protein